MSVRFDNLFSEAVKDYSAKVFTAAEDVRVLATMQEDGALQRLIGHGHATKITVLLDNGIDLTITRDAEALLTVKGGKDNV